MNPVIVIMTVYLQVSGELIRRDRVIPKYRVSSFRLFDSVWPYCTIALVVSTVETNLPILNRKYFV